IVPLHDAGSQVRTTADRQTGNGVSPVRGCDGQHLCAIRRHLSKRKLTAVCSHQTRIGNLDAHLI
ncbi:hypothetical protein DEO16_28340, partial [Escherichia coli]